MAFLGAISGVGFIVGIALIILGRIKKKKYYGGLITVISLVLFFVALSVDSGNDNREAEKLENMTVDERIVYEVEKELGETTNTDKQRVISHELNNGYLNLVLAADNSINVKSTKEAMLFDATDVFPIIFSDKSIDSAMVTFQLTFVDTYGNESEDDAIRIKLTRETNDKINWENFNIDNFPDVADSFYVHPGMNK